MLKEIATGKSHKDIAALFNARFDGVGKIQTDQIKYIKAQYRKRLDRSTSPASRTTKASANRITKASAKRTSRAAVKTSSTAKAIDTSTPSPQRVTRSKTRAQQGLATTSNTRSIRPIPSEAKPVVNSPTSMPARDSITVDISNHVQLRETGIPVVQSPTSMRARDSIMVNISNHMHLRKFGVNVANRPEQIDVDDLAPSPRSHPWAATHRPVVQNHGRYIIGYEPKDTPRNWNEGAHEGCVFQGPHQHCVDGGIYFPSVDAIRDMIYRMKGPSVPLSVYADIMEMVEAEAKMERERKNRQAVVEDVDEEKEKKTAWRHATVEDCDEDDGTF